MPRWLIALVSTVLGIPLLALALVPYWVGYAVLGLRHPGWDWVYAVTTFVGLVGAIVAIVKIETTLMRRADAATQARAAARLGDALAALRNDPRLAQWAPLAERYQRVDHEVIVGWESRYQALLADPRRHAFAARALAGAFPEDHEIDYLLDPSERRTCEHLRPLEGALRSQGIACTPIDGAHGATSFVFTAATLDEPAVRRTFALPDFVEWRVEAPEPHDAGSERLYCTRCHSWLESGRGPIFPARV